MSAAPKSGPWLELHAARSQILQRFDGASLADLQRLADLLHDATHEQLARALAYLEGLVDWDADAVTSIDGPQETHEA